MTTSWNGRQPSSYSQTLYNAHIAYDTNIRYDGVIVNLTPWSSRPILITTNTISPIVTGMWNDANTWLETGKYWNDSGDGAGTTWSGRTLI